MPSLLTSLLQGEVAGRERLEYKCAARRSHHDEAWDKDFTFPVAFKMKAFVAFALGLQAVTAKVSYEGYKVFHIETTDYEATESALSSLEYVSLNCESDHKTLEVAVAPESLEAFEKLGLNAELTVGDLGAEIAVEGELKPYEGT